MEEFIVEEGYVREPKGIREKLVCLFHRIPYYYETKMLMKQKAINEIINTKKGKKIITVIRVVD